MPKNTRLFPNKPIIKSNDKYTVTNISRGWTRMLSWRVIYGLGPQTVWAFKFFYFCGSYFNLSIKVNVTILNLNRAHHIKGAFLSRYQLVAHTCDEFKVDHSEKLKLAIISYRIIVLTTPFLFKWIGLIILNRTSSLPCFRPASEMFLFFVFLRSKGFSFRCPLVCYLDWIIVLSTMRVVQQLQKLHN